MTIFQRTSCSKKSQALRQTPSLPMGADPPFDPMQRRGRGKEGGRGILGKPQWARPRSTKQGFGLVPPTTQLLWGLPLLPAGNYGRAPLACSAVLWPLALLWHERFPASPLWWVILPRYSAPSTVLHLVLLGQAGLKLPLSAASW